MMKETARTIEGWRMWGLVFLWSATILWAFSGTLLLTHDHVLDGLGCLVISGGYLVMATIHGSLLALFRRKE